MSPSTCPTTPGVVASSFCLGQSLSHPSAHPSAHRSVQHRRLRSIALSLLLALPLGAVAQDVTWICSRPVSSAIEAGSALRVGAGPDRSVAADADLEDEEESMALHLRDLMDAYSGRTVALRDAALSVCSLPSSNRLHAVAMSVLGLRSDMPAQTVADGAMGPAGARASGSGGSAGRARWIVAANVQDMAQCVASHHPAVGYLPETMQPRGLSPCF